MSFDRPRPWPQVPAPRQAQPPPATSPPLPLAADPTSAHGAVLTGMMAALILAGGLAAWSALAAIDGAILAPGQVEAARVPVLVQHPDGGRVAALAVTEGQAVAAGQALLTLDAAPLTVERAALAAHLAQGLALRARLTAERDGAADVAAPAALLALPDGARAWADQRAAFAVQAQAREATRTAEAAQAAQVRAAQAGLDAAIAARTAEGALIARDLARAQALAAQGLAPAAAADALARDGLRAAAALAATRADRAALGDRLAEVTAAARAREAQGRSQAAVALADLGPRLAELAARHQALAARVQALTLRAPVAGRVHALMVSGPGTVLRPAEAALRIVPDGAAPLIAARLRPDDLDRVRPGQPVQVRLPATGGRDRPALPGRIVALGADAVPEGAGTPRHIRVDIALDPQALRSPDAEALRPGLPIEAQIATGARSPLAWLLAPLSAYFDGALREG